MNANVLTSAIIGVLRRSISPPMDALYNAAYFNGFLRSLGWTGNVTDAQMPAIRDGLGYAGFFDTLADLAEQMEDGGGNATQLTADGLSALLSIMDIIRNLTANHPPNLPAPLNQGAFWNEFPRQLIDRLVVEGFENEAPVLGSILFAVGITDKVAETPTGTGRLPYIRYSVNWDALGQLFTDPLALIKRTYVWGGTSFRHQRFLAAVGALFESAHYASRYEKPISTLLDAYYSAGNPLRDSISILKVPIVIELAPDFGDFAEVGVQFMPIPPKADKSLPPSGFWVAPLVKGSVQGSPTPGNAPFTLSFKGGFQTDSAFRFEIRPDSFDLVNSLSGTSISAEIALQGRPERPYVLIGAANSHRLELEGFKLVLGLAGPVADPNDLELKFGAGTGSGDNAPRLRFILQAGEGDGFIRNLIGSQPVSLDLSGMITWSSRKGIGIDGNVGFVFSIPIHQQMGPINIDSILIEAKSGTGLEPRIGLGLNVGAALGPIAAVIEGIGAQLVFRRPEPGRPSGLLGDLDLDWRFQPPKGVGLALDSGGFKGGGFLSIDHERGRYIGALDLTFRGFLTLKAVGIITTKNPGGSDGFSLLIIITAEFPPIQLSFGFTLNAVGGLLALNRTINLEALRDGVRTNAIRSVLFPTDIVANITRIVSDLESFFPVQQGRFAFGPMFMIGWGTPTLISIELGLLIEVPNPVRIAILGVLKSALPHEQLPILRLQVNFLGTIDFEKGLLSFDATLYDSRLLTFGLSGDMAVRLSWGTTPGFILSVGGFHPAFQPPPMNFPHLRRITINLLADDNPRLRLESYFAVTSNTVQVGSRVELYAAASKFNVYGFLGYDTLIQFNPFQFIADFAAMLAVRCGSDVLFSVRLQARLTGPTPWHAKGRASFSILFFDVTVGFDLTWGADSNEPLPTVRVLDELKAAFQARQSWQAILPDSRNLLVSLREIGDEPDELLLHPAGFLRIAQRSVPLNVSIQKYGNRKPTDGSRFRIDFVKVGNAELETQPFDDHFAAAQFLEMTNSEKLARPSFEKMQSGIDVRQGGLDLRSGKSAVKTVRYERIVLDSKFRRSRLVTKISKTFFDSHLSGNSAALSALSVTQKADFGVASKTIAVQEEGYRIVNVNSMQAQPNTSSFTTYADAAEHLNSLLQSNPALTDEMQILSTFELEAL